MAEVDISDLIERVLKRVVWLDQKIEIYEEEPLAQCRLIDQFNKTIISLLKLLVFAREDSAEDELSAELSRILEAVYDVQA